MKNQHSTHPDVSAPEIEILTVHELSQFLKRSPAAVRNLVLRRRVPFRRCAGRITFFRHEILEFLEKSEGVRLHELKSALRD